MKRFLFFTVLIIISFLLFCNSKNDELQIVKENIAAKKTPIKREIGSAPSKTKTAPLKSTNEIAIGQQIDQLNNIPVYFNGETLQNQGRNKSATGYNYGLKWQCVEFVKRYYYDHLGHTMPDTYGHAKDFYAPQFGDGELNTLRNLFQYKNGSFFKPRVNDILVFHGDQYGHVAIISNVTKNEVEIIQQNVGVDSRYTMALGVLDDGTFHVMHKDVLGWLGKR